MRNLLRALPLLVASSSSFAVLSVTGNTISWPDDGWYQVQATDTFEEICAGGSSCVVEPGTYNVINHSTGQRYTDIVVEQDETASSPTVSGNTIFWPDDGWYQVQTADTFLEVCAGGRSCTVEPGTYVVINHTTGKRYTDIIVKGDPGVSPIVVIGRTIYWPDNGWYQVQNADTYQDICSGVLSCLVDPGTYIVINHTTGQRYNDIVVDDGTTTEGTTGGGTTTEGTTGGGTTTEGTTGGGTTTEGTTGGGTTTEGTTTEGTTDGGTTTAGTTDSGTTTGSVLARSGIPIPGSDFELDIGDFDGDGRSEVLSTDSRELIFTLEFDGESIKQDWLYPYSVAPGESILRLWAYGTDLSKVLVVTTRGVSLIESRSELPTRVLDTTYDIAAASINDFDGDGVKEVLLIDPTGLMSKLSTTDWSLAAFGETLKSTEWPSDHYSIAVGNLDDDAALEIVVDTGQVIDGATGQIQWTHISPFGSLITIGDVDGDGDPEIVASNRWQKVTSYDPVAQTSIWAYDINDFCSLRLYNVDSDPQDELIAGPCQHGSVEIYDGSTGTMWLQDEIGDPAYNSSLRSYSLGDLDNDGVNELIFSTGSGSSAEDNMAVVSLASLGDSTPGVVVNVNPSQINGFKSIGWDTTTTAKDRAVFVLPETEGGDDGQRVGLLSTNGEIVVSDVIAANWNNVAEGVVVDSDADGISEAVVGVGNVYNGEVHHLTLDDFSRTHLHTEFGGTHLYLEPEIVSMSLGIDSDMSAKAIIATDQSKLQVYDIASRQAEWTSGGLTGGDMREAIAINKDSGFDIVASTRTELTLWKQSDVAYKKSNTAGIECSFIRQVVISGADKIACVLSDVWGEETKLTLFSSELIKEGELDFDYAVTALKSTPDGEILIGAKVKIGSGFYDTTENTLRTIDPSNGTTISKSAPLLGEINEISFSNAQADGKKIMAVSTSSAMYIFE